MNPQTDKHNKIRLWSIISVAAAIAVSWNCWEFQTLRSRQQFLNRLHVTNQQEESKLVQLEKWRAGAEIQFEIYVEHKKQLASMHSFARTIEDFFVVYPDQIACQFLPLPQHDFQLFLYLPEGSHNLNLQTVLHWNKEEITSPSSLLDQVQETIDTSTIKNLIQNGNSDIAETLSQVLLLSQQNAAVEQVQIERSESLPIDGSVQIDDSNNQTHSIQNIEGGRVYLVRVSLDQNDTKTTELELLLTDHEPVSIPMKSVDKYIFSPTYANPFNKNYDSVIDHNSLARIYRPNNIYNQSITSDGISNKNWQLFSMPGQITTNFFQRTLARGQGEFRQLKSENVNLLHYNFPAIRRLDKRLGHVRVSLTVESTDIPKSLPSNRSFHHMWIAKLPGNYKSTISEFLKYDERGWYYLETPDIPIE